MLRHRYVPNGRIYRFQSGNKITERQGNAAYHRRCIQQIQSTAKFPQRQITNYVKEIYAPFTQKEISKKIAQMLTSEDITSQVEIIYQTLEGLHQAIPNHPGDWYFSGNYPTPGGNRLVNNAFINFVEGIDNKRQL